jgi:teichuronic acid exporter
LTSLKKKSISGFLWDFTGKIGLQGAGFFVSIILARILSPEDFGLLAIITVFIGLANVFLDFGFSTALVQRSEVTEAHYSSVFFMNVAMGCLLGMTVFLLAPYLAAFYNKPVLTNLIRVMSVCFVLNSFGNVTRAHLRREMNFKILSYSSIAAAIISGVLAVYMAYQGYGVWSLVAQVVTSELLTNVFLYFGCRLHFSLRFSFEALKELWGFSSKLFFTGLLDTLFANIDSLLIGKLLNPASLGYYYRARSLESFSGRYTSSTISSVLLPVLSSIQNEPERLKQAVLKLYKLISFLSFFVCGTLLIGARELIILIFSSKWEPSVLIFQIIIAGAFAPQIFNLFYNVLISTANVKRYFVINMFNKVLFVLNFCILFYGGLTFYLIGFVGIQIIVFYVGLETVSNKVGLGKLLYFLSIKDIVIYGTAVVLSFIVKNYWSITNLYWSFIFSVSFFASVFIAFQYMFNREVLRLVVIEIESVFNKKPF